MSGRERPAVAGPSDISRQQQKRSTASPFNWTMSLFGGRQGKQPVDAGSRSLGWGRPGASASARNHDEREALISNSTSSGGDDFDDSDAISLLSNIADRDSRRGGGASAAARRRARARARAQGRTCGTFWFDVEDWSRSMSCGLLGRGAGNNEDNGGRQRAASIGSVMSRGARRTNAPSSTASVVATSRHSRSLSNASTDSGGSLAGSGFAESVDADAGMLDDQAIARFGQPSTSASANAQAEASSAAEAAAEHLKAKEEEEAKAKAKAEAEAAEIQAQAERQKAREAEAARLQHEAEAEAQRQKEEEARLAAEEEAAIAKARRKAERKAAKAGLLKLQQETQAAQRWRTEAEAEAAAGGFTFADAEGDDSERGIYAQQQFDYRDTDYNGEERMHGGEYDQYGDAEEADGYYATVQEQGPGGVVHHHHYYHAAPPVEQEEEEFVYPGSSAAAFADASGGEDGTKEATADKTVSEDEADIAGLSFGRKKSGSRRNDSGSASGSRSGNGLTARTTTGGSSSGGSASAFRGPPSASSSSAAGRAHYRDRPRRHERTSSKSSNSSSGIFSYQSSNTLHPGAAPSSTAATSVTSPPALPNLYESEPIYTSAKPNEAGGTGDEVAQAHFGKPDVDANEFGVITAGTNKGGAGRVKKSYRDKRSRSQVVDEQAGKDSFEGFPGF